jgi:tetratricopeptide (TPR) repeat protein
LSESTPKSKKTLQTLKRKADLLYQRGVEEMAKAKLQSARASLDQALLVYSQASDQSGVAQCLLKLGRSLELLGEYDRAQETYQGSLDLYVRLNDPKGTARAKAFLGDVAWAKGGYTAALKLLEEALLAFRQADDKPGQAWVSDMMGNLCLAQGKHHEAENFHRSAYAMALEVGESPEGRAWNEYHLAAVELFRGHREAARAGFLNAQQIFTELGDVLGEVAACTHLGEIACDMKNPVEAQRYILQAIRLVLPTQCKPLLADALTSLVRLLKARGEEGKAVAILMVVLSHPTCRQQTKDRMVSLSKAMEANFSAKELESGFTWAKEFTIEEMARAWLKALSPKDENAITLKARVPKKNLKE